MRCFCFPERITTVLFYAMIIVPAPDVGSGLLPGHSQRVCLVRRVGDFGGKHHHSLYSHEFHCDLSSSVGKIPRVLCAARALQIGCVTIGGNRNVEEKEKCD